jgi:hypothetical protein
MVLVLKILSLSRIKLALKYGGNFFNKTNC